MSPDQATRVTHHVLAGIGDHACWRRILEDAQGSNLLLGRFAAGSVANEKPGPLLSEMAWKMGRTGGSPVRTELARHSVPSKQAKGAREEPLISEYLSTLATSLDGHTGRSILPSSTLVLNKVADLHQSDRPSWHPLIEGSPMPRETSSWRGFSSASASDAS